VGQAKAWWIRGIFRLEAAEELVPNNESAAMVAVDVTGDSNRDARDGAMECSKLFRAAPWSERVRM